jgi:hypothetical protein
MGFERFNVDCLEHVRQFGLDNCVIATAAMIGDVSFETAAARSPVPLGARGLCPNEIIRILEAVTGVSWDGPRFVLWPRVSHLAKTDYPFAVGIREPWTWQPIHCIAIYKDWVHDGHYPWGYRKNEYPKRHWRVLDSYHPVNPERLLAVRQYRKQQRAELPIFFPEEPRG